MNIVARFIALGIALSSTSVCGESLFPPTIDSFLTEVAPHWTSVPMKTQKSNNYKVKILKNLFHRGKYGKYTNEMNPIRALVIEPKEADEEMKVAISQEVYFLSNDQAVYERYLINGQPMKHNLLKYHPTNGTVQNLAKSTDIFKRRANFQGLILRVLTDTTIPFLKVNINESLYDAYDDRYRVANTDMIGPGAALIEILQSSLNFTAEIYQNKKRKWGIPVRNDNGTIAIEPGMVKDVMDEKADMIFAALAIIESRFLVLDYSFPVSQLDYGIFISKSYSTQGYDFMVFLRPFSQWTWLVIIANVIVFHVCAVSSQKHQRTKSCSTNLNLLSQTISSLVGQGDFTEDWKRAMLSSKLIFLNVLFLGALVWMSYNAFLTSSLLLPITKLPFNDMQSLIESGFKVNTNSKGSSLAGFFLNAAQGTPMNLVLKNNMDDSSFNDFDESVGKVVNLEKHAVFAISSSIISAGKKACKVSNPDIAS